LAKATAGGQGDGSCKRPNSPASGRAPAFSAFSYPFTKIFSALSINFQHVISPDAARKNLGDK
jgi:hypothetical protein